MSEEIRFFLPGPVYVREDVRQAMTIPSVGHRSPEFHELFVKVSERLSPVFRSQGRVLVVTSSGSLSWEMSLRSAVRGSVLNLTCGAFSERWHTVAKAMGLDADQVAAPWGQAIDPELVRQSLRRKRYAAVTLAHNETSTGVLNPLAEIARVVREESDALIMVDGVSSVAGAQVETDEWGLDLIFTGAQKALALPPGLAFICMSERYLERARNTEHRGHYSDLVRWYDKHVTGYTLTTPAVPQVRALDVQLDHILGEGLEQRWARHLELRRRTEEWAAQHGMTYASSADGASPTVSCLRPPEGIAAPELVARVAAQGITLGGGYGAWKAETVRVGHMGEVRMADLERLLQAMAEALAAG